MEYLPQEGADEMKELFKTVRVERFHMNKEFLGLKEMQTVEKQSLV